MTIAATPQAASMKGVPFVLFGIFVFTIQDVIIKWMSGNYPVHEIVFVRNLVAILPVMVLVYLEGGWSLLKTRRPWPHVVRAVGMFLSYLSFYLGIAAMPLADAVALFFVAPLLITALSVPFLGEQVGLRRWIAVIVGLGGVVVMLRPGGGVVEPAGLLMIFSALSYAVVVIITRRIAATEKASTMALYACYAYVLLGGLIGALIGDGRFLAAAGDHASLAFMLRAWQMPSLMDFGLMVVLAFITAIGFYCLSQAYRQSEASMVAPFEYIAIPLATLWGYLFWDQLPDRVALAGMAMIVGSGLYVLKREARRGRRVATARSLRPKL